MSLGAEKQFFAEFEFSKDTGNYWFPVLIYSENEEEAKEIRNEIESVLKNGFTIVKPYPLFIYKRPHYSIALKSCADVKNQAEIFKLNLKSLNLVEIQGSYGFSLNQHIAIEPQNLAMIYAHTIQYHMENHTLLTTQVHHGLDYDKEFLVLKVF